MGWGGPSAGERRGAVLATNHVAAGNTPSEIEIARLMGSTVEQFCASYSRAPTSIILDVDDTFDAGHGRQQLSLFNAHYDERCFLPIHIYEGTSGKPVADVLRSGKTPGGVEVRTILNHVIARIRRHWPKTGILVRGDSRYGRPEVAGLKVVMSRCPAIEYPRLHGETA